MNNIFVNEVRKYTTILLLLSTLSCNNKNNKMQIEICSENIAFWEHHILDNGQYTHSGGNIDFDCDGESKMVLPTPTDTFYLPLKDVIHGTYDGQWSISKKHLKFANKTFFILERNQDSILLKCGEEKSVLIKKLRHK